MRTSHRLPAGFLAFLLSVINFPFSTLFAQGSAFTYQGRLTDSGSPANGNYDLRFTLYDAISGGTILGGPVTNTVVGVSNGLFTVVLDFGAGPFDGNSRWLDICARSNGAATIFTTLAPRQQLTATPYAIAAGNLNGTVSTAQLTGTLPASVFAGAFGIVTTNNLDNSTWLSSRLPLVDTFMNLNRYSWTRTLTKLRLNQTIRVQLDGNGLMAQPQYMPALFVQYLAGLRPISGFTTWFQYAPNASLTFFGSNGRYGGGYGDTNWFAFNFTTTNASGNVILTPSGYAFDTVEVDYIGQPNGGHFKIQTNGVDVPGFTAISTMAASRTGLVTRVTFPQPITGTWETAATDNGTNIFVNWGAWNSQITNGLLLGQNAAPSSGIADYLITGGNTNGSTTNIMVPIYKSWSPDLLIWSGPNGPLTYTNTVNGYNITNLFNFFANLQTDVVYAGNYPFGIDATNLDPQLSVLLADLMARSLCPQYGYGYFDGYQPFVNYSNWAARGFGAGDGVHATRAGYNAWSSFLWNWMGLDQGAISTSFFVPGQTGLYSPPFTVTNSTDSTFGYGAGLLRWDTNYLYISVGTNQWKRVGLNSW
jgi:hypothetical protein